MPLRDGPFGDRRPRAGWRARLGLAAAAALALLLLTLTLRSPQGRFGEPLPQIADGAATPLARAWAAPFRWLAAAGDGLDAYILAGSQNAALRRQVRRLRGWRDAALAARSENERLRALLGVRTDPPMPLAAGRAILEARGPFSRALLADVGADHGVVEGNPVLSELGLVGRVVEVSAHACRVLLLTDVMSRTPVLLPRTNGRAILAGDGGGEPVLAFLRTHEAPRPGDRVLTSGDGGVFPRGLTVGSVVRGLDGAWRVALDSDAAPVDWVQVLLFKSFAQLAPRPASAAPLPTPATEPPPPPIAAAAPAAPSAAAKPSATSAKAKPRPSFP